jgi:outer membrane protein TolC
VEVLRWTVDYQQQRGRVVSTEAALRNAAADLRRLVHSSESDSLVADANLPAALVTDSERFAALPDDSIRAVARIAPPALLQENPNLAAAQAREEVSRLRYKNAQAAYLPDLSLSYSYAWRENNTVALDEYATTRLSVQLRFPIFTGFDNLTSMKSTYYDYKEQAARLSDQVWETRAALDRAANRVVDLKYQRLLHEATVELTERTWDITAREKAQGLASNLDLIDARLNLQSAQVDGVASRYDLMSAVVELHYLTGRIGKLFEGQ